jgi:hypothetical protein
MEIRANLPQQRRTRVEDACSSSIKGKYLILSVYSINYIAFISETE